jgi:hypothetical protein
MLWQLTWQRQQRKQQTHRPADLCLFLTVLH